MYICVLDDVPTNYVPLVTAHASLACYLTFKNDPKMEDWQKNSFRKVICGISRDELEMLKKESYYNITTESSLGGIEVAISFCPRESWPTPFKYLQLWKS